jgi:hypothetical protein
MSSKTDVIELYKDDHIHSLRALLNVRCKKHGEYVMIVRKGGKITFWCGCKQKSEYGEKNPDDELYCQS